MTIPPTMFLSTALAPDAASVLSEVVVGDYARALPIDQRASCLVIRRPQHTIDRVRLDGIEQHHFSETVADENLLPKFDGALQSGRHKERRFLRQYLRRTSRR